MAKQTWGTKRTCTCGIRFYDLNKKEIECPSCGETVNVELLSISTLENNLRKKPQAEIVEEKEAVKEKNKESSKEADIEIETSDNPKIEVEEIIGDKITEDKDKKSDE